MVDKTKIFTDKAIKIHQDTYDYSLTEYIRVDQKVKIICKKHGVFQITPNSHLNSSGCRRCAIVERAKSKVYTQEIFLEKAKNIFGEAYLYDKTRYVKSNLKITVTCKIHGDFEVLPANHLDNQGCMWCGAKRAGINKRSSQEHFIERCKKIHNDFYDYSKTEYVRLIDKIVVVCRLHGPFQIKANNHSAGKGCTECSLRKCGYRQNRHAHFYILKSGDITKVGITNRKVELRRKVVSRTSSKNFEIIFSRFFEDGKIPYQTELQILKELRLQYQQTQEVFDGSTECFLNVDTKSLIARINELLT